jgi:hypothetical protein
MLDINLLQNKNELLEEDMECIHLYLDNFDIPRIDIKTNQNYSIVGRIKYLEKMKAVQIYDLEQALEIYQIRKK